MAEKRGEETGSSTKNKLILKKAVTKKIKQINSKAFISDREVYELIRSFFKKHLDVDYEFTHQELMKELRRIYLTPELQQKVDALFKKISEVEHSDKTFTREELEQLLKEFNNVVDQLIVSHYQKEKSFGKKFKDWVHKIFSTKHKDMLNVDESVLSENERIIVKMNMLLDNSKRWSGKNIEKAKEAYKELMHLYESLGEERQKIYYPPIQELYQMIRSKDSGK